MDENRFESYCNLHPFAIIADSVVFGRDYRLNELPRDRSGKVLYLGESEFEYYGYINWLADYLYNREIEPNDRQSDLCRLVARKNRDDAMYLLGMYGALHEHLLVDTDVFLAIDEKIEDPRSYSDADIEWIYKRALEIAKEYDEWAGSNEENNLQGVFAVDITPGISHERIRQYLDEDAERIDLCDEEGDFCDVGWRVPLSLVLKDVTEKTERVRLLKIFFELYSEYINK